VKKAVFSIAIILFVICLVLTIQARISYPKPVYEPVYPGDPRYTGEVIEYLDRLGGWEVQWVLVYDPGNPAWVEFFQGDAPFFLFIGLLIFAAWSYPKKSYPKDERT